MSSVVEFLVALFVAFGLPARFPDQVGLATSYGPPGFCQGDIMRNGQPLDLVAPTIAVNSCRPTDGDWCVEYWPEWKDREAVVYVADTGEVFKVRVTDTGRLYAAGKFRLGIRGGVKHYWSVPTESDEVTPVAEFETTWLSDYSYRIVADFPEHFFNTKVSNERFHPWRLVAVWVLDEEKP